MVNLGNICGWLSQNRRFPLHDNDCNVPRTSCKQRWRFACRHPREHAVISRHWLLLLPHIMRRRHRGIVQCSASLQRTLCSRRPFSPPSEINPIQSNQVLPPHILPRGLLTGRWDNRIRFGETRCCVVQQNIALSRCNTAKQDCRTLAIKTARSIDFRR